MNRIVRWLRIGGVTVVAVVVLTAVYLGLSFWKYGSDTQRGPGIPQWFTAGFDYAVDETPLRWPILRVAELIGVRERHEHLSVYRRVRAWLARQAPVPKDATEESCYCCHPGAGWLEEMHAYYASREASFFPLPVPMTSPTAEVDDARPLLFDMDWEELKARRYGRQAQQRCQE